MAEKLTHQDVRELPGPGDGRAYLIHYDSMLPGFGLRVTKAGARSLVLNYRAGGIERRITLGSVMPDMPTEALKTFLAAMRERAHAIKGAAKYDGRDVLAERKEDRNRPTMARLCADYLEKHAIKKRSEREDERMIRTIILPALRNRRVEDVEYSDVDDLHRKVTKGGAPIVANRVVSLLSKMFALAIKWKMRTDNPAKGIDRNPENRRQRYLAPDELKRLSVALAKHKQKASANVVRLLLLTGARRGEALGATWDQFDFDKGIWTKPSSHTKQKKTHIVPLSAPARQLLADMREAAQKAVKKSGAQPSPFLFPGAAGKPQTDLKHFWASVCEDAKISGVRVHDMRHTYASVLASAGQTLPIIGQLLGHTNPSTTARYAHLFDDPLRAATERAGAVIDASNRKKSAKVLPIRRTLR